MATEILVPELGESVLEATVGRWVKKVGDPVRQGEVLVELETDKVNLEVGATQDGVLTEILHQEGEDVKVGEALARLAPASTAEAAPAPAAPARQDGSADRKVPAVATPAPEKEAPTRTEEAPARATPVAARIAREEGIDLEQVHGTGAGGRTTKDDVLGYLEQARPAAAAPAAEEPPQPSRPPLQPLPAALHPVLDGREERVRMSRRRRTIAQRLVEAQHAAAMLTTFNEVDMGAVMDLRKRRNEEYLAKLGVKLGITAFFVKASVAALKAFPRVNAEVDGEDMILKHYYDIGVAVGDEEGLVVPVLRGADSLSLLEIERGIGALARKAREKALDVEDLRGSTFTITNGGVFGSLMSTPILNAPEVAILGLHKVEERPVAIGGQVVIRPMMYLALSYDHRIVDGREAVQFLVKIKELIESPEQMLIEG